jgi:hypothetical protein
MQNGLWFNTTWTAAQFTAGWRNILMRYKSRKLVAATDETNDATVVESKTTGKS